MALRAVGGALLGILAAPARGRPGSTVGVAADGCVALPAPPAPPAAVHYVSLGPRGPLPSLGCPQQTEHLPGGLAALAGLRRALRRARDAAAPVVLLIHGPAWRAADGGLLLGLGPPHGLPAAALFGAVRGALGDAYAVGLVLLGDHAAAAAAAALTGLPQGGRLVGLTGAAEHHDAVALATLPAALAATCATAAVPPAPGAHASDTWLLSYLLHAHRGRTQPFLAEPGWPAVRLWHDLLVPRLGTALPWAAAQQALVALYRLAAVQPLELTLEAMRWATPAALDPAAHGVAMAMAYAMTRPPLPPPAWERPATVRAAAPGGPPARLALAAPAGAELWARAELVAGARLAWRTAAAEWDESPVVARWRGLAAGCAAAALPPGWPAAGFVTLRLTPPLRPTSLGLVGQPAGFDPARELGGPTDAAGFDASALRHVAGPQRWLALDRLAAPCAGVEALAVSALVCPVALGPAPAGAPDAGIS